MNQHPRIPPVESPAKLMAKIGFYVIRKQFGKVTTVAKVIYARFPAIMMIVKKIFDFEEKIRIPAELQILIQTQVAWLNGCTFCIDTSSFRARKFDLHPEKLGAVKTFQKSELFTDAEKSALRYTRDITRKVHVDNECYSALREHWSDEEIIEITFTAAAENFLNRLVKPLGIESDNLCDMRQ